jgi:chromate reductase
MQQPEIYLNGIGTAFDDKGNLTTEALEKVMKAYIDAFAAWVDRLKK